MYTKDQACKNCESNRSKYIEERESENTARMKPLSRNTERMRIGTGHSNRIMHFIGGVERGDIPLILVLDKSNYYYTKN